MVCWICRSKAISLPCSSPQVEPVFICRKVHALSLQYKLMQPNTILDLKIGWHSTESWDFQNLDPDTCSPVHISSVWTEFRRWDRRWYRRVWEPLSERWTCIWTLRSKEETVPIKDLVDAKICLKIRADIGRRGQTNRNCFILMKSSFVSALDCWMNLQTVNFSCKILAFSRMNKWAGCEAASTYQSEHRSLKFSFRSSCNGLMSV